MKEGDGTVLDHSCIMLANEQWTAYNSPKIPMVMAGGLGDTLPTGRSLDYENASNRKMSSLLLSIMDRMGVALPAFGDATDRLDGIG